MSVVAKSDLRGDAIKRAAIVVKLGDDVIEEWVQSLQSLLARYDVRGWREPVDKDRVRYVAAWNVDALWVNKFNNLEWLISTGSGVDHIKNLSRLRPNIGVVRTVSPELAQRMREFVTMCVLAWHRSLPEILERNEIRSWHRFSASTADGYMVGIMGLGNMGSAVATTLQSVGYSVSAWANRDRPGCSFPYYRGRDQLLRFLSQCDVVVCLLPLTPATNGILNYEALRAIRTGGCLINVGRGAHIVDEDLVRVMEEGHLSAAFLDTFRTEPLPATSSFYDTPGVFLTFHSAAYISPENGPKLVAERIRALGSGRTAGPLFSRDLGY